MVILFLTLVSRQLFGEDNRYDKLLFAAVLLFYNTDRPFSSEKLSVWSPAVQFHLFLTWNWSCTPNYNEHVSAGYPTCCTKRTAIFLNHLSLSLGRCLLQKTDIREQVVDFENSLFHLQKLCGMCITQALITANNKWTSSLTFQSVVWKDFIRIKSDAVMRSVRFRWTNLWTCAFRLIY